MNRKHYSASFVSWSHQESTAQGSHFESTVVVSQSVRSGGAHRTVRVTILDGEVTVEIDGDDTEREDIRP
jgi:hypothetical protein